MGQTGTPGALGSNVGLGPLPERRRFVIYNEAKGYGCDMWSAESVREFGTQERIAERARIAAHCDALALEYLDGRFADLAEELRA